MRALVWVALAGAVAAAPLAAQGAPGATRRQLQQRIETLFMQRATEELALTPDQATRLREMAERTFARRRALEAETQRLNALLAGQLRPGVAADQDSVARLVDSLVTLRVAYAEVFRDEEAEMAKFLTPVQRAQYYVLRERLLQRIQQVRQKRLGGGGGGAADPGDDAFGP
ncbi:MAG TPA: Spy/CpxP family protein refolding chaperone [Gemmatimonadales bacterium]|nr:Spy/CpxP family protein refolding chaperone [Gemmatimonadales bacterium]